MKNERSAAPESLCISTAPRPRHAETTGPRLSHSVSGGVLLRWQVRDSVAAPKRNQWPSAARQGAARSAGGGEERSASAARNERSAAPRIAVLNYRMKNPGTRKEHGCRDLSFGGRSGIRTPEGNAS